MHARRVSERVCASAQAPTNIHQHARAHAHTHTHTRTSAPARKHVHYQLPVRPRRHRVGRRRAVCVECVRELAHSLCARVCAVCVCAVRVCVCVRERVRARAELNACSSSHARARCAGVASEPRGSARVSSNALRTSDKKHGNNNITRAHTNGSQHIHSSPVPRPYEPLTPATVAAAAAPLTWRCAARFVYLNSCVSNARARS